MIKNIVFDMSRVLMEFDTRRYAMLAGVPEADLERFRWEVYRSPEWLMIEREAITPAEAAAVMCANLPEHLHACVRKTVGGWWEEPIIPMQGMAALVRELKEQGYGLYLLSNARREAATFFQRIPGSEHFDGVLFSYMAGVLKPQKEIYLRLYDQFRLDPAECLFVDDVTANIEAGISTGMRGIVFRGDTAHLRRQLRLAGVSVNEI